MTPEELLDKWEKELESLKNEIRIAGQNQNRAMIDFLYPKMQQVHDFVEDLKLLNGK